MDFYSYDVNYNNCPDTFTYYFFANSDEEVAQATGVDIDLITKCSPEEVKAMRKARKHYDVVLNGALVEVV